jgi:hypothetical protein
MVMVDGLGERFFIHPSCMTALPRDYGVTRGVYTERRE